MLNYQRVEGKLRICDRFEGKMEVMQRFGSKARFLHPNKGFQHVSASFNEAFWSIDVYKCHKLRHMNVCVCVIHL